MGRAQRAIRPDPGHLRIGTGRARRIHLCHRPVRGCDRGAPGTSLAQPARGRRRRAAETPRRPTAARRRGARHAAATQPSAGERISRRAGCASPVRGPGRADPGRAGLAVRRGTPELRRTQCVGQPPRLASARGGCRQRCTGRYRAGARRTHGGGPAGGAQGRWRLCAAGSAVSRGPLAVHDRRQRTAPVAQPAKRAGAPAAVGWAAKPAARRPGATGARLPGGKPGPAGGARQSLLRDLHLRFHRPAERRDGPPSSLDQLRLQHRPATGHAGAGPSAVGDHLLLRYLRPGAIRTAGAWRQHAARQPRAGPGSRGPARSGRAAGRHGIASDPGDLADAVRQRACRPAAWLHPAVRWRGAGGGPGGAYARIVGIDLESLRADRDDDLVGTVPPRRRGPAVPRRAAGKHRSVHPRQRNEPMSARRRRRTADRRRRPGAWLPSPSRPDRRTLPARPVRRRRFAPVPHRRPGSLPRRWGHRIPWTDRPSGEDPGIPHRTRRNRDAPAGAGQRARGGGRRPAGGGRAVPGGLPGAHRGRAGRRRVGAPAGTAQCIEEQPAGGSPGLHGAGAHAVAGEPAADAERQDQPQGAAAAGRERGPGRPCRARGRAGTGHGGDLERGPQARPHRSGRQLLRAGRPLAAGDPSGFQGTPPPRPAGAAAYPVRAQHPARLCAGRGAVGAGRPGRDRPMRQGRIAAAVVRPGTPVVHLAPGSAQRGLQHPGGVASEGTAAARCPAGCPGPAGAAP
ncbi:TPA: gramicidin biosynthesis protein [Pseudomonas aeruginosa]|nr:gramicidin biosynthesis protein [Pseudomonas aeruginosa]HBP6093869.1 gramicidin biosynthesis protein [Pseudomonas aeruginosa]